MKVQVQNASENASANASGKPTAHVSAKTSVTEESTPNRSQWNCYVIRPTSGM